jgi:Fibrinogen beta and gamma chains, C-terminal globular domain
MDTDNLTLTVYGSTRPVLSINTWIIVQNKVLSGQSSTSFNQPWTNYRNGFGDLSMTSNYWIGNEIIYGLVSMGEYRMKVEVRRIHDDKLKRPSSYLMLLIT